MKPSPRLSLVTLGVTDLARSTEFYEALGWGRSPASQSEITFFRAPGTVLALYGHGALAADAHLPAEPRAPFGGITLAMNLRSEAEVDEFLELAARAGARLLKPAQHTDWGGYSGYFADPDGHPWEVACNPHFAFGPDGSLALP